MKNTQLDAMLAIWAEEFIKENKLEDESEADTYFDMLMDRVNMIISEVINHYHFKISVGSYKGPWRSTAERPRHNSICFIRKLGMSLLIKAYYNVYDNSFYTSTGTQYPFIDVYMWAYIKEYNEALKNDNR